MCVTMNKDFVVVSAAEEPGTLSESGGASAAEPPEEHRGAGSAALQPLVQTLLRRLPAGVQPAEVFITLHRPRRRLLLFFLIVAAWRFYLEISLTLILSWICAAGKNNKEFSVDNMSLLW